MTISSSDEGKGTFSTKREREVGLDVNADTVVMAACRMCMGDGEQEIF